MLKRLLFLRALAAFLALPGVVALVVPLLIAAPAIRDRAPFRLIALVPLLAGLALLLWCVRLFLVHGKGTLAPWDPPRQLVITGPYAFSRNPMYVAATVAYAAIALVANATWPLLLLPGVLLATHVVVTREERLLEGRFGAAYRSYKTSVRRYL